ncbi:hypothetical protein [Streptomyces sp. KL110A]|uniref:hypothetical protein n=1 Tax=Streptomyces sp. KL110A TaxID=3384221 RepID=UPI0038C9E936
MPGVHRHPALKQRAGARLDALEPGPPRPVRHLELDDEGSFGERHGLAPLADLVDDVLVVRQDGVVVVAGQLEHVDDEVVVAPVVDRQIGDPAGVQQHVRPLELRLLLGQPPGTRER